MRVSSKYYIIKKAQKKYIQPSATQIMTELASQLKKQIIKALNLENVKEEDIKDDDPLFGEGLGLDSIDALELIVLLEKEYGLKIENPADAKKIFLSVKSIADYITENKKA